jgi:hypothetical protein
MFRFYVNHLQGVQKLRSFHKILHKYNARINIGCGMNVVFEPPEDGLHKTETYVGGRLIHNKSESEVHFVGVLNSYLKFVL